MFTEVISPLQQEFKSCNEKLSHLHPKSIFRLAKLVVPPSRFIELKYDVCLCASCIFVTARRMQWITKVNKTESIRKYNKKKTVYGVSVD